MSEPLEIFVDGVKQLHFTGNLVRLDFKQLWPDENTEEENLRLIMDPVQAALLRDSLNSLLKRIQEVTAAQKPRGSTLADRYNPGIFSVTDMDAAKRIILTKEGPEGSEERWQKETPALMRILQNCWKLDAYTTVVDYGCGIGRISKELCNLGCYVVGVDISPEMRKLAVEYVDNSTKFQVVSPQEFETMLRRGFSCNYVCAIWVLQHCLNPGLDLGNIRRALKDNGELFVVNNKNSRAVPVVDAVWQNDGIDIWQMCRNALKELRLLGFPEGVGVDARHFQCGFYQKIK